MNRKLSVVIPSRNERFLQATIDSLLAGATGDIEILACLDGYWPDPPLREDPRVRVLHWSEPRGMRPSENTAIAVATGDFLMKLDAHCLVAPGYDEALTAACEPGTLVVPTRHSIDPDRWLTSPDPTAGVERGGAVKWRHWNYHLLTFPYSQTMYGYGMHAVTFPWDSNKHVNAARRAHAEIDDLMSFQGSCWVQRRADFLRLGPLDHEHYYFYQEAQEVGLRVWLTGGRCLIHKGIWYAHLHKGSGEGRGFYLSLHRKRASERFAVDFWTQNRWPGQTRTFESLVEQFWSELEALSEAEPKYAWPADWREWEKHRIAFETRPPDQIPAHI